jgi:hypothetical protein
VTPLSADRHIYQASSPATANQNEQLALLTYARKLGAPNGWLGNNSFNFVWKTSWYFGKLISSGKRFN